MFGPGGGESAAVVYNTVAGVAAVELGHAEDPPHKSGVFLSAGQAGYLAVCGHPAGGDLLYDGQDFIHKIFCHWLFHHTRRSDGTAGAVTGASI